MKLLRQLCLLALFTACTLCAFAEPRTITTSDGVDLYVTVKGAGPPCLYVHGGPGSGSYWLEKFSGDILEQQFRMVYLDQRGVARSTSPKGGNYSLERTVCDFEEVRKALGITEWFTLGHSLGGIMQMAYAQRYPGVVKGMLMFNCTLSLKRAHEPLVKACEILGITNTAPYLDESVPINERLPKLYRQLREKDLFWKMGYASYESKTRMDASFADIAHWNKDQENAEMPGEYFLDCGPLSARMKMPVLFVYGKTDWMVGPSAWKEVRFPNVLLWGSEVGHVPFLENKPDVAKAIQTYRERFGL